MKKFTAKKLLISIFVLMCTIIKADASKLPDEVWQYIKQELPEARQRFDSVITLDNGIMYVPLYPASEIKTATLGIEYSYPYQKKLSQLPEVVLFNNGYSLLKIFKDKEGNYTLTQKDDLPIKVRLGLMPQDMLIPVGLKLPESLKLTLGDLLIPSAKDSSLTYKEDEKEKPASYIAQSTKNEFVPCNDLKNKKTMINSGTSKFLEVFDETSKNSLYELKLSAMPSKIAPLKGSDLAVVSYWSAKFVDIVNLKDENIISQIELKSSVSDIAINQKDNLAYVTCPEEGTIYIIDIQMANVVKIVKLDQKPTLVVYCEFDDTIAFFDEKTSQIFNVTRDGADYVVQPMGEAKNPSKILSDPANIYVLSRTQSNLSIYDKTHGELILTAQTDTKPTDAMMYNRKIYILCSKENYLDIYDIDSQKITQKTKLSSDGFYSKITPVPNSSSVLLTGLNTKNYLVYDLDKMTLSKKQDSNINISNIVIVDKSENL